MVLEVCANSFESAKNAQLGGAKRIELCQELSVGGITPSYGLVKQVVDKLSIPVFALVRPRSGHFVYSTEEMEVMLNDIQLFKKLGCSGIVSGALHLEGTINVSQTKELIDASGDLPFTFHRAFDEVLNPKESLLQLIDLGVTRVLSSGQKSTAFEGITLLSQLRDLGLNQIKVMPGAGVNEDNILKFKEMEFEEVHSSASMIIGEGQGEGLFSKDTLTVTSTEKVKAMVNLISKPNS
ncbi:copper homeostasis protein CutC [Mangrovimonas sp. CR14]|uniref:copper homeostasis protein CutC n=1 Tax=Mangrovimonas sp. CR14 TaxID=2706120 RepID=UPI0014202C26|nr:copper homeostasis protein CutC [Mangrovimonas sp. CR14]NIK90568.1 copper homeostasis protein CutC [Mangrovimonas sp. CR14]